MGRKDTGSVIELDIRKEFARIKNLSPQGFDQAGRELLARQSKTQEQHAKLEDERKILTLQLDAEIHEIAAGNKPLDSAARQRTRDRLQVIDDELAVATRVLEKLKTDIEAARARGDQERKAAWKRLQHLAILELDEQLETARRSNALLSEVQNAAPPKFLESALFGELTTNTSGTSRLDSWRLFVMRECGVALEDRE